MIQLRHKVQGRFERIGFVNAAFALGDQSALDPVAQLFSRLGRYVGGVNFKVGVIGVCGQQVGQRLHGRIERHTVALVLEQGLQPTEHERPTPRCEQQPRGVLLACKQVFLRALLVEGGHGWVRGQNKAA